MRTVRRQTITVYICIYIPNLSVNSTPLSVSLLFFDKYNREGMSEAGATFASHTYSVYMRVRICMYEHRVYICIGVYVYKYRVVRVYLYMRICV